MKINKIAGICGIAAGVICWSAMIVFAALRPSYSHSINAVSELGAIGTENALWWNIIGFITPGFLLAVAGAGIAAAVTGKGRRSVSLWLLVISGLGFAGTGFSPAELENGAALLTSPFTKGHFIASLIHGFAWLLAAIILIRPMKRSPGWKNYYIINIVLALLVVLSSTVLRGHISDALVQRIAGGWYFIWFLVMSINLARIDHKGKPGTGS